MSDANISLTDTSTEKSENTSDLKGQISNFLHLTGHLEKCLKRPDSPLDGDISSILGYIRDKLPEQYGNSFSSIREIAEDTFRLGRVIASCSDREWKQHAVAFNDFISSSGATMSGDGQTAPDPPPDKKEEETVFDQLRMECLTAIWLALYFLGCRHDYFWERTRWMAEDTSGYPAGVCQLKAFGDVYARMRRLYRAGQIDDDEAKEKTLAWTFVPICLLPLIEMDKVVADSSVPESFHDLGRIYHYLHLRLYAADDLPIKYGFSLGGKDAKRFFHWLGDNPLDGNFGDSQDAKTKEAFQRLLKIFPNNKGNQEVIATFRLHPESLVPCVIGTRTGCYSFDPLKTVPFPCRRASDDFRNRFRGKLDAQFGQLPDSVSVWGIPEQTAEKMEGADWEAYKEAKKIEFVNRIREAWMARKSERRG